MTQLHKDGLLSDPNNYQPVSILPVLSKVLEKIAHEQVYAHLRTSNYLSDRQSGFRKGYSTTTCLIDFLDNIYNNIENGVVSGVLFLDLKKAFNYVHHRILLCKLRSAGLTEASVNWFSSYLTHHTQYTKVNNTLSDMKEVRYGVPQGSILGPLLFIIFINDLSDHIMVDDYSTCHLYADDTAITIRATNNEELHTRLQQKLNATARWMKRNLLTVNTTKTKLMFFGTNHTLSNIDPPNIVSNKEGIEIVDTYKYLGVMLDSKLTFTHHVTYLRKKSISRVKMLGKVRPMVDQSIALTIYKTIISPLFDYADVVFDCLSQQDSDRLQRIQNWALRIILQADPRTHILDMHKELKLNYLVDRTPPYSTPGLQRTKRSVPGKYKQSANTTSKHPGM